MNTHTVNTKVCSRCKVEKPRSQFNRHVQRKDGLRPYCRECQRVARKLYREKNIDKEKERVRKWHRDNPDYHKNWMKQHGGRGAYGCAPPPSRHSKQWYASNPGSKVAHMAVRWAQYFGVIPLASEQACSECGEKANLYHHTHGYSEEHWLTVVPMCATCHRRTHASDCS